MKTFKQYIHFIKEELDIKQKKTVDRWIKDFPNAHKEGSPNAVAISKHVIPEGSHKVTIPLENADHVEPHPDVEQHLKSHGYQIDNYKKGTVKDKYDRSVSIGKVLEKTKADSKIKHSFLTDPNRKGAKQSAKGLVVTITRHPHHIAGMSTGQGWTSCMDMKCGFEKRYLKDEVKEGTHAAYLHHADDPDMKKPIARLALRPYHSEDKKETILRAEPHTYGDAPASFKKTVDTWTENHFHADKNKLYHKNKKVYDDGSDYTVGDAEHRITHPNPEIRRAFFYDRNKTVTHKHIDRGLEDKDFHVRHNAIMHPNATDEHLKKALNDENSLNRYAANSRLKKMEEPKKEGK
jgi:hypothetical protein